jgi:hypothetical protein
MQEFIQGVCVYIVSTLTNCVVVLRQGSGSVSKISMSDHSEMSVDINTHRLHDFLEVHVLEVKQGERSDEKAQSKFGLSFEMRVRVFFKDQHVKCCLSSPFSHAHTYRKFQRCTLRMSDRGRGQTSDPVPHPVFFEVFR